MSEIIGKDEYAKLPATSPDVSEAIRAMIEPLVITMIENKAGAVSIKTATTDGRRWEMFCQLVEVGDVSTVASPIKSKGEDRHAREVPSIHPEEEVLSKGKIVVFLAWILLMMIGAGFAWYYLILLVSDG